MRRFNHIFLHIIHSFYYMLGSILLYIVICDNIIDNRPNFNYIVILTLLFYFIVLTTSSFFEVRKDIDLIESNRFIAITTFVCLIAGIMSAYKQGFFMAVFTSAYFVIISLNALKTNRVNTSLYFKMIKSLVIILIVSSIYISDKAIIAFGNSVVEFVFTYFAVMVLYFVCINFNEHYESKNSINKNKNLFILNFFVASIIFIITFFRQKLIYIMKIIKEFISPAIDSFLEKAIDAFNSFMEWLLNTDFMMFATDRINKARKYVTKEKLEQTEAIEKIPEELGVAFDFSIFYNILIIIFVIILIFVVFKSLKSYRHKRASKRSYEEREFIFKKDDFINDLKNNLKNKFKKKESLPKERLIYKKAVKELIKKGYNITNTTTPNEYINSINTEDIKEQNFDIITSNYNSFRYGKDNT